MRAASFRDRALVVRTYDFGEADRVIVLLTRGHGLVRGVAKGVRRARSRFGSRLQLFVLLDVQLYPGRSLASITGADTVEYYGGIIDDYPRYTAACGVLEAAERLSVAELGEDTFLFDATCRALRTIRESEAPTLDLAAFLLKAMDHAGWAPSLFDCAQCGKPGPHRAFHPGAGGALCVECRPPGAATPPPDALHLMWLLAHGRPLDGLRERGDFADLAAAAHRLTSAHLQWHLERRLPSLKF